MLGVAYFLNPVRSAVIPVDHAVSACRAQRTARTVVFTASSITSLLYIVVGLCVSVYFGSNVQSQINLNFQVCIYTACADVVCLDALADAAAALVVCLHAAIHWWR